MIYFLHTALVLTYGYVFDRQKNQLVSHFFWFPVIVVLYAALPSLQYGVGTDYFNYIKIYDGVINHQLFDRKNEHIFYFIYDFIINYQLGKQSIFIVVALIQASIFYIILIRLKSQNYSLFMVILIFLLTTGIYQNQMNGLRTYTAALLFILAFILRIQNSYAAVILVSTLGLMVHSTFLAMLLPLILPVRFWELLGNRLLPVYIMSFIFWISPFPVQLLEIFVNHIMPFYAHYLSIIHQGSNLINVLTKAYWIPLHLLFFSNYNTSN